MPTANRQEFERLEVAAKGGYAVFGLPEQMPDDGGDFECTIAWEDGELGGASLATNDTTISGSAAPAANDVQNVEVRDLEVYEQLLEVA